MASDDMPVFVPAPDLPAGGRSALIIATSEYADPAIRQLRSPVKDAEDFAAVLGDQAIGGFTITSVTDGTDSEIKWGISEFLDGRHEDDMVVVYLSCHGIKSSGRLYFVAANTRKRRPQVDGVAAAYVLDELDKCPARRQILILDCCYSGGFAAAKGDDDLDLESELTRTGRGRWVLTGSRASEYSFEGEPVGGQVSGSVFTTGLVEGLRAGAADSRRTGLITVEDAYQHAFGYVLRNQLGQTPERWVFGGEGEIVLARSAAGRAVTAVPIPAYLADILVHNDPDIRIGGVNAMGRWLTGPDPARALAARRRLAEVIDTDIAMVGDVARSWLERASAAAVTERPPPPVPPALSAPPRPSAASPSPNVRSRVNPGILAFGRGMSTPQAQPWFPRTYCGELTGHTGPVNRVAFDPSGILLASVGQDGTVLVWDVPEARQLSVIARHEFPVTGVAVRAGGQMVSADEGGRIESWNVYAGTRDEGQQRDRPLYDLAVNGHDQLVATAHAGGRVNLAEVPVGFPRFLSGGWQTADLDRDGDPVVGLAFGRDGKLLATAGPSGDLWLVDVAANRWTSLGQNTSAGTAADVLAVTFSPDGSLLAAAGSASVRVVDVATGEQRLLLSDPGTWVSVTFSPDGVLLAAAAAEGRVHVWETATGKLLHELRGTANVGFTCVAFSPASPLLAAARTDGTVRLWR